MRRHPQRVQTERTITRFDCLIKTSLFSQNLSQDGVEFVAALIERNSSTQVFDLAFLKVDSDQVYEVAQKHGGEKLTKKDPKQPVFLILDWDARKNTLLWHVIYGTSMDNATLRVAVNATSGQFERIEK